MIDEDRTMQLFGYTSDKWAPKSCKKVIAVCEECGRYRVVIKQQYRDLCHKCAMSSPPVRHKLSVVAFARPPVSDATRHKMSTSKIGNTNSAGVTPSIPARQNMSEAQKRRSPPSLTTRRKIGEANHLRIVSEETCGKISCNHADVSGANNPNWAGGVTPWRKTIFNTPVYKKWRESVFGRDGWTCQMCYIRGGRLEAHHIRPVRDHKNDLLIFDVNNGITLCRDCHRSINRNEYDFIERFDMIIGAKK